MEGYLKNPEATEESRAFAWHHSGDLGFIDEDGLLKFVDRKKESS
jgi:long-chain acyl-CoA synthetase